MMRTTLSVAVAAAFLSGCAAHPVAVIGTMAPTPLAHTQPAARTPVQTLADLRGIDTAGADAQTQAAINRWTGDLLLYQSDHGTSAADLSDANIKETVGRYQAVLTYAGLSASERADTLYRLAHAQNLAGDRGGELKTLTLLTTTYPHGRHLAEAQFRRGELLFDNASYHDAAIAYQSVLDAHDAALEKQATYMLGWAHYKAGQYAESVGTFMEIMMARAGHGTLDADTQHAVALAFDNLGGAPAVKDYFAKHPANDDVQRETYLALASLYHKQERHFDAVQVYQTYLAANPNADAAPDMDERLIAEQVSAGDPAAVLAAKTDFVTRFGLHSAYYAAHDKTRAAYLPALRKNGLDVADYYLAMAQKSQAPADYKAALPWYAGVLSLPGKDDPLVRSHYADALYAAGDYEAASAQYDLLGANPAFKDREKAAFVGLIARQADIDKQLAGIKADPHNRALQLRVQNDQAAKIDAEQHFVATFPKSVQVLPVLKSLSEDQLAQGNLPGVIVTNNAILTHKPAPDGDLARYALLTLGNAQSDTQQYAEAEGTYRRLLARTDLDGATRTTAQGHLAESLAEQGNALKAAGKTDEAAQAYLAAQQADPRSDVGKSAILAAADLYRTAKEPAKAIPVLTAFTQTYPGDKAMPTVLAQLADAYQTTGNAQGAVTTLAALSQAQATTQPELARQALWQAATLADNANLADTQALYQHYVTAYPVPSDFQAEARQHLVALAETAGNTQAANAQRVALKGMYQAGGNARVNYLAAQAADQLAAPLYAKATGIALTLPLKTSLAAKSAAMKEALDAYTAVGDMKVADFTTEANAKIAALYQNLSDAILASQTPPGMDELTQENYQMLLQGKAMPYSDKAIDLYTKVADLAHGGLYDQGVKDSFAALATLVPGRFHKPEQETPVAIPY